MTVVRVLLPDEDERTSQPSASPVSRSDLDPTIASTLLSTVPADLAASAVAASESVATTFAETQLAASSRDREDSVTGSDLGESMASSAHPDQGIADILQETVSVFSSQPGQQARAGTSETRDAPANAANSDAEDALLSWQRSFCKEFERLTQSQESLHQRLDQAFAEIDDLKTQGLTQQTLVTAHQDATSSNAWKGDLQRLEAQMWDLERWARELHDRDETTRARHLLTSGQDILNLQERVTRVEGCMSSTKSWQEHQRVATDQLMELPRLASDLREALRSEARQLEEHLQDIADLVRGSLWGPAPSQPQQGGYGEKEVLANLETNAMKLGSSNQGLDPSTQSWEHLLAQKYGRGSKLGEPPAELSSWEWLQSKLGIQQVADQASMDASSEVAVLEPCQGRGGRQRQGDSQRDHVISLPARPSPVRRPMPANVPVLKIAGARPLASSELIQKRMNVDAVVMLTSTAASSPAYKGSRSTPRQFHCRIAAQEAV